METLRLINSWQGIHRNLNSNQSSALVSSVQSPCAPEPLAPPFLPSPRHAPRVEQTCLAPPMEVEGLGRDADGLDEGHGSFHVRDHALLVGFISFRRGAHLLKRQAGPG